MKQISCFLFLMAICCGMSFGQSLSELERQYKRAKSPIDKAKLGNQLAQGYLTKDGVKALGFAKNAYKNAVTAKIDRIQAEALNFQAKATAGTFYPGTNVPRTSSNAATQYDDAVSLYKKSMDLAKRIKYHELELDNLENLAYINKKKVGRHSPDPAAELKYYKMYIARVKNIKDINVPQAVANVKIKDSSPKPEPGSNDKPASSDNEKFARQLIKENKELKETIDDLENDIADLNIQLKKATASGATAQDLEEVRKTLELKQKELSDIIEKKDQERQKLITKYKGKEYQLVEAKKAAEDEVALANATANQFKLGASLGGIIAALILGSLFIGYRYQTRARKNLAAKNEIIAKEQEESKKLLLNILPENIAVELKEKGAAKARKHSDVSVLFSDFKNFTKVAERSTPEELVKELDYCFKGFDYIISQYPSIEKIKTIGDAYMCCSGLSGKHPKAAEDMVKAAMEIQEFLYDYKADRQSNSLPFFEARIGIHTGTVVSGVVGSKKFAYDIWGDSVNVASRMETNGDVGKVNISADTYRKIQHKFSCQSRGKISVKNKGMIEMYFVDREYV